MNMEARPGMFEGLFGGKKQKEEKKESGDSRKGISPGELFTISKYVALLGGVFAVGQQAVEQNMREGRGGTPKPVAGETIQGFAPLADPTDGEPGYKRLLEPSYTRVQVPDSVYKMYLDLAGETATQETELRIGGPYTWASDFETTGAVLALTEDEARREQIRTELNQAFTETVVGFSWDKSDEAARRLVMDGVMVTDAVVYGLASDDASDPSSIGRANPKNQTLATKRANLYRTDLIEVIGEMGGQIRQENTVATGMEVQFSPEQESVLLAAADKEGIHGSANQKIHTVIFRFDHDQLKHGTAGDIRGVMEETRAAGAVLKIQKEKEAPVVLLPAPLPILVGLLGMAAARFLERIRKPEGYKEPIGPKREPISDQPPRNPENEPYVRDVVDNDLIPNFASYEDGYYGDVIVAQDVYADPDTNEMTHEILDQWTHTANRDRAAQGKPPEAHHRTRPEQVVYANLHAHALKAVIEAARASRMSLERAVAVLEGNPKRQTGREAEIRTQLETVMRAAVTKELERLRSLEKTS